MRKVLFGGAFDLLHTAHVKSMVKAKEFGDYLVVAVSSDARVRAKKGKGRPIIPEEERVELVEQLSVVDEVVYLSGDAERPNTKLFDLVKPNIFVIEVSEVNYEDREECEKRGIRLVVLKRINSKSSLSTTKIIDKISNINEIQIR